MFEKILRQFSHKWSSKERKNRKKMPPPKSCGDMQYGGLLQLKHCQKDADLHPNLRS
jgi:hypothetical protein